MGIGNLVGSLPKVSNVTLVLAVMGVIATAGLVSYLSNQVSVSADVQSPMKITITGASSGSLTSTGVAFGTVTGNDKIDVYATLKYLGNQPLAAGVTWTEVQCTAGMLDGPLLYSDVTGITNAPFSKCGTANGNDYYYLDGVEKEVGFSRDMTLSGTVSVNYVGAAGCIIQAVPTSEKKC